MSAKKATPKGRKPAEEVEEPETETRGSRPAPGRAGRGRSPGLARLNQVQMVGTHKTGLEDDPEIADAIDEDDQAIQDMDAETDVDAVMDQALEEVSQPTVRDFPLGNGTTVPFPDDGEDTTDVATCRKSVNGVNRGCMHHTRNGRPWCPMGTGHPLAEKYDFAGPANVVYKNLRTGLVKTCHCVQMMSTYLHMPNIVLLPGPEWYPTRTAEYKPLPNGQQPTPGPGQARTPIVLKPHKTKLVCVPPEELVREFQAMRRRGDFVPKERRRRRGGR